MAQMNEHRHCLYGTQHNGWRERSLCIAPNIINQHHER
jgi:hypothetical protein